MGSIRGGRRGAPLALLLALSLAALIGVCAQERRVIITAPWFGLKANNTTPLCVYLLPTAAAHGLTVSLADLPKELPDNPTVRQAEEGHHLLKFVALVHFLKQQRVTRNDVVVIVDATDNLVQGTSADILAKWDNMGQPSFLASSEWGCWPKIPLAGKEYDAWCSELRQRASTVKGAKAPYLNSGGILGRGDVLLKYFSDVLDVWMSGLGKRTPGNLYPEACAPALFSHVNSDQGVMQCTLLAGNPYGITLDYGSELFMSLAYTDKPTDWGAATPWEVVEWDEASGKWADKRPPRTVPLFIHGNGPRKRMLWPLRMNAKALEQMPRSLDDARVRSWRVLIDGKQQPFRDVCEATFKKMHRLKQRAARAKR